MESQCQTYLNLRLNVGGQACSSKREVNWHVESWLPSPDKLQRPGLTTITKRAGCRFCPTTAAIICNGQRQASHQGRQRRNREQRTQSWANCSYTDVWQRKSRSLGHTLSSSSPFIMPLSTVYHFIIDDSVLISTSNSVYTLTRAVTTKSYKLSDLTQIYSLLVLEVRSPRPKCWQGWFLLRTVRETVACFSARLWWFTGSLWHLLTYRYINPISVLMCMWYLSCVCIQISFL